MTIIRITKKFNRILSYRQKVRVTELIILMIIGGLLETCSVSLILPFMNAVMNPQGMMDNKYVQVFCNIFHLTSPRHFLLITAIALALIYIFKNVYLMFEYSIQYRFVYRNMFAMQSQLLKTFINRPYEYFLNINSGEIIRIVTSDTQNSFELLITLLSLFTEIVVAAMLIVSIFMITPVLTMGIAAVLLFLLMVIYVVIKPRLRQAGFQQQRSFAGMNKWLLQSIQGIKELKIMRKEQYFQNQYDENGKEFVRSIQVNQTLKLVPRFTIEGVCMGIMFVVVALMILSGTDLESIIPMLTAVSVAAIRLLPSVNRISAAMTQAAYNEPMLDKMLENLDYVYNKSQPNENPYVSEEGKNGDFDKDMGFTKISFENISYHYPDTDNYVLKNADVTIMNGDSVGIVGPSGAGKTTAVDLMLGLLEPQEGIISVDDIDIKSDMSHWLGGIGYIPQSIFLLDDTIRANVAFGEDIDKVSDEAVWDALKEAALDKFVKDLPNGLETEIGERGIRLSGGQRQRIGIARALYRSPQLLVFDEATSALDNGTESAIMDSINRLHGQKTLVIIAHRLSTIGGCDCVYRIDNGIFVKER